MKIYLVTENDYDGGIIHGAYTNIEAAEEHQRAGGKYPVIAGYEAWYVYDIEEVDVIDSYGVD